MVAYVVLEAEGSRREEKTFDPPPSPIPEAPSEEDAESQERLARLERVCARRNLMN